MTEHTFVIRIWCEPSDHESIKPQFRGVIEHATNGQRQYLADAQGISQFIAVHLPNKSRNTTNKSNPITQWIDQQK